MLAGLEGIYEPAAVAMHMGKSTFGKGDRRVMFLSARNQVLLLAKHYPAETLRRFAWPILVGQILAVLAAAKQGTSSWRLFGASGKACGNGPRFRDEVKPRSAIEAAFSESELEIRRVAEADWVRYVLAVLLPSGAELANALRLYCATCSRRGLGDLQFLEERTDVVELSQYFGELPRYERRRRDSRFRRRCNRPRAIRYCHRRSSPLALHARFTTGEPELPPMMSFVLTKSSGVERVNLLRARS